MREMNHELLALISDFLAKVLEMWPKIKCGGDGRSWCDRSHRSGQLPWNFHKIHDDPGISDVAAAFIMGWIGTGCPVRHRLKSRVCDCLRNRSESSVFYSCRFSFSGLVAAKLAMVIGI